MRKSRQKRVHTAWFDVYKTLENAKESIWTEIRLLGPGVEGGSNELQRSMRKLGEWVMGTFAVLIVVMIAWL